jgi:hypothetical protein
MLRMSMELQGACGCLLWWLLGSKRVALFDSTRLDVQTGLAWWLS